MTTAQSAVDAMTATDLGRGVEAWVDRTTAILERAPDDLIVPATPAWSVHDVAAHLRAVVRVYADGPSGTAPTVDDLNLLPALNDRLKDEHVSTPTDQLATEIRGDVRALAEQVRGYGDDPPSYRFNGGAQLRADRALGLLVGELAIHGHDIAEAIDRPWPMVAADAEMVFTGMEEIISGFVDPTAAEGHSASYEIRVRGGRHHRWEFRDGYVSVVDRDTGRRADCTISAEPGELLLVMYRRRSPWGAALTGRIFAWGRRPWLGLRLADRFHTP